MSTHSPKSSQTKFSLMELHSGSKTKKVILKRCFLSLLFQLSNTVNEMVKITFRDSFISLRFWLSSYFTSFQKCLEIILWLQQYWCCCIHMFYSWWMWKSGTKTMIFHKRKAAIHAYSINTSVHFLCIFYKIYQSFILTSVFIYCKDVPIVKHAQAVTVTIHHIVELCTKLTIQAKLLHRHISGLWSELLCCTSKRLDIVWIRLHFP